MKISSSVYDKLKFLCLKIIPALTFFLGVVGDTLDLDWMIKVITILGALGESIGIIIGISSSDYWKDKVVTNIGEVKE